MKVAVPGKLQLSALGAVGDAVGGLAGGGKAEEELDEDGQPKKKKGLLAAARPSFRSLKGPDPKEKEQRQSQTPHLTKKIELKAPP